MPNLSLNWGSLIRVDSRWINDFLITHTQNPTPKDKIVTRVYSIRFASTGEHMDGLVSYMRDKIVPYVYSDKEIDKLRADKIEPWPQARDHYFGAVDPASDGKCGEFLLYLLVEATLRTPMVAHKIRFIGDNPNTQVHGSDAVFIGKYRDFDCLLLGEAKMQQDKGVGIDEALTSVNKFYSPSTSGQSTENELIVVRDMGTRNITKDQLKYLEKVVNIQTAEYRSITKAHPILIVYDESKIKNIEIACRDAADGEAKVLEQFQGLDRHLLSTVIRKIDSDWHELKKVYLDFFFMPVTSVDKFRESFFQALHGMPYPKKKRKQRKGRRKTK